ncbi:polymer-forming cytoskeletal protein [Romeria aff. gracilis LEGE 07310]|uniref:Polymer-forming cytoskeletal protein n=1 Tax=Vasconcelosia minhoensis LEGE 07310 TaxID=915328 RepID=A0A8J7DRS6_9CYAN|nr:polymer-forming cytoskeletal protein [Romeria gracilis]MBE9079234.1 polymer-forming cytoskeletal protein [Romeria aff. gracilis LEGE 07310]
MRQLSPANWQRFSALAGLLLLVSLFLYLRLPASSWAMESRSGEQVTIAQNEVIEDDLYVSGAVVTIDGTVRGDVIGAGRQITVNGTVEGDLTAAGRTIVIDGTIDDDVRIAGQVLQLGENAQIGDDVVAAGASLESMAGSAISGDLSFRGAQALLAGTVQQDFRGAMAALELQGTVDGNASVDVGGEGDRPQVALRVDLPFLSPPPVAVPAVAGGLTVTDSAQIAGTLNYRSRSEAEIAPDAQIAGGANREIVESATPRSALIVWDLVQRWITLLLVGVLIFWVAPGWMNRLTTTVQAKPLASLGWGIAGLLIVGVLAIAIPAVTILLTALLGPFLWNLGILILGVGLLTNILLVVSFLLFIGYVPAIILSSATGQRLLYATRSDQRSKRIAPLAVGLLFFVLLTAIPILGNFIYSAVVVLGVGALLIWGRTGSKPTAIA